MANNTLAKLVVMLEADSARLQKELDNSRASLTRFQRQSKTSSDSIKGYFTGVTNRVFNLKTAIAGLAGGGVAMQDVAACPEGDVVGDVVAGPRDAVGAGVRTPSWQSRQTETAGKSVLQVFSVFSFFTFFGMSLLSETSLMDYVKCISVDDVVGF